MRDRRLSFAHLVSGAAGFIGSHLCDRLMAEGHEVVGLDNFLTGIANATSSTCAAIRDSNLCGTTSLCRWPWEGPSIQWHLASLASPKDYLAHPIETLESGSAGTRNMLEIALAKNAALPADFDFGMLRRSAGASAGGNILGQRESGGLRSCYDESKRYAEALTMAYHRKHGVRTNIARIFNTYGPRMALDDGRVVPAFLDQALRGKPLTVFGDGSQTRSFCYVSDLVDGLYRLDAISTNAFR